MAGLPDRGIRGPLERMLRMDQVHVVRHKVLVEGRSQRAVARELGLARVTVRKYLDQAVPVRKEARPRPRPVWEAVASRVQALLVESGQWTGGKQQLTATRLHALLVAEGHARRRHRRQGRGRGVEAAAPRGLRAADVSTGRSGRGRLLRGAGRRRWDAPQGVALSDAADVLRSRLRVDLRAPGSNQLSRRARARVRALRRRAGPRRVRQSAGGGGADPGRRRAHADAAVQRARVALSAGGVLLSAGRGPRQRRRRGARQGDPPAGAGPDSDSGRRWRRSMRRCSRRMDARVETTRDAVGQTIGVRFAEEQRLFRSVPTPFAPEATTLATVTPRALVRLEGAYYSVPTRWAGWIWWCGRARRR